MPRTQKTDDDKKATPRVRPPRPGGLTRLVLLKRAGEESNIPYTSLRDAHHRGELAIVRIGRCWYVTVQEFEKFLERQTERASQ